MTVCREIKSDISKTLTTAGVFQFNRVAHISRKSRPISRRQTPPWGGWRWKTFALKHFFFFLLGSELVTWPPQRLISWRVNPKKKNLFLRHFCDKSPPYGYVYKEKNKTNSKSVKTFGGILETFFQDELFPSAVYYIFRSCAILGVTTTAYVRSGTWPRRSICAGINAINERHVTPVFPPHFPSLRQRRKEVANRGRGANQAADYKNTETLLSTVPPYFRRRSSVIAWLFRDTGGRASECAWGTFSRSLRKPSNALHVASLRTPTYCLCLPNLP